MARYGAKASRAKARRFLSSCQSGDSCSCQESSRDRRRMVAMMEIEAIYENGVLRPLKPVPFVESQTVKILIPTPAVGRSQRDLKALERAKAEVTSAGTIPSIEEIRELLSTIPGSLSDDVIAERGDY